MKLRLLLLSRPSAMVAAASLTYKKRATFFLAPRSSIIRAISRWRFWLPSLSFSWQEWDQAFNASPLYVVGYFVIEREIERLVWLSHRLVDRENPSWETSCFLCAFDSDEISIREYLFLRSGTQRAWVFHSDQQEDLLCRCRVHHPLVAFVKITIECELRPRVFRRRQLVFFLSLFSFSPSVVMMHRPSSGMGKTA